MPEFIYTMTKARKAHGDKVILDDVTLSFFPGAKIGVVGPERRRQVDDPARSWPGSTSRPTARPGSRPGYTVGILLQEPPLNEEKTVLGNVEEGAGEIKAKLDRYNEISPRWPSRTPTSTR